MITVDKTPYGLRMTAPGFLTLEETQAWFAELKQRAGEVGKPFAMLVDIRSQPAQSPEVSAVIQEAMAWLKASGMQRSAVVLDNPLAYLQVTRLARNSGVHAHERYFDASSDADWERKALAWLGAGHEPG